jgi:hypothetical protein
VTPLLDAQHKATHAARQRRRMEIHPGVYISLSFCELVQSVNQIGFVWQNDVK